MSLSRAALRRPVSTIAAVLAVLLLGAVTLARLPVTLLPDVTLPVLTVRAAWTGAAAEEVARLVAEPLEQAVAATPGLVELRSASRTGESTLTLRFAWGTDMAATTLLVRERLDAARGRLPERADRPTLLTSDPGERPIAILALGGRDLRETARVARDVHARRLEQIDGIAAVAVVGAPADEIRVTLDPDRLRALDLTPDDVARAIRSGNAAAPGGTVRRGQFQFSVRAQTEFRSLEDVRLVPVGPVRGGILLRDVATVALVAEPPRTLVQLDGKPAVGLVVYKDAGSNTVAVTGAMTEALAQLGREFPQYAATVVSQQATFVRDALSNLGQEIVAGGVLSLLVILLFLKDGRSSLAIGLMVPLSVLVALVLLQAAGVSVNILSLGGLALGVGLLVDNAIVVTEATARHRERGLPALAAAEQACADVSGPLLAGTVTTIVVFGPIIFVRGLAGALFRDLSLSVAASLAASLVLALTLLPVMVGGRLRGPAAPRVGRFDAIGERLAERYEDGMRWCLRHPARVFTAAAIATVLAGVLAWRLPREILPQVDEGVLVANLRLPPGTPIETTAAAAARVEAGARTAGASGIYARVGAATDEEILAGADPGGANTAQLILPVPRGQSAASLAQVVREAAPDLAAGALALDAAGQSEFGSLIGREGRLVRVEVGAARPDRAAAWADSVQRRLRDLPMLLDVREAGEGRRTQLELSLLRDWLAQRGITPELVGGVLTGAIGGLDATDLRETDRRVPIRLRLGAADGAALDRALATTVRGVPLGQLVEVREVQAPVEVLRVGQRPVTAIEGTVASGGTAAANEAVLRALDGLVPPPDVTWRVAGADAEQRRTSAELAVAAGLSIVLVYLVLAAEFASFTVPLLVMLTVPLAGVGGIVVLWLTGQSLNAVSLIGLVVMIGLADNDAVVKLDAIRRLRDEGLPVEEAVLRGGRLRLRAIAMTSLTTIVGVLPLILGLGSGGELYQPLAAGVIGGSITATLVTFFLLPTAYAVAERRRP
jgi:HAE1 family hydrophobic/amphiphilic exporter-1